MTIHQRALPQPTDLTRPYWDAAQQGRLVLQHCSDCGSHQFYPRPFCIHCMSTTLKWVDSSGKATIYTYTINRRGANPYMGERVPYVVALVELEEGVRMMANIVDTSFDRVQIGLPVRVTFERVSDEVTLPQFRIA